MKKIILKTALMIAVLSATSYIAEAQQKFGDNLGNHKATKDLDMNTKQVLNTSGVVIGSATALTNTSIALQIGTANQAIVISSVALNGDILLPVNGMIIYNTTDKKFFLYQDSAWVTLASISNQQLTIPAVTLGTNEATKIVITGITGLLKNGGVVINFDADDLTANADLGYISILNAAATANGTVTVTVADMRQYDGTTALSDAGALLTGKHFTLTRF